MSKKILQNHIFVILEKTRENPSGKIYLHIKSYFSQDYTYIWKLLDFEIQAKVQILHCVYETATGGTLFFFASLKEMTTWKVNTDA